MWIQSKCEAKKIWDETKSGSKKILAHKNFGSKYFGPIIVVNKSYTSQQFWIPTNFWPQIILVAKKFWNPKKIYMEKCRPKENILKENFWIKKPLISRHFTETFRRHLLNAIQIPIRDPSDINYTSLRHPSDTHQISDMRRRPFW